MNKKSSVEILEKIYQSMSNGMRNPKAHSPRQWLIDKKLSFNKTYAAFNSHIDPHFFKKAQSQQLP